MEFICQNNITYTFDNDFKKLNIKKKIKKFKTIQNNLLVINININKICIQYKDLANIIIYFENIINNIKNIKNIISITNNKNISYNNKLLPKITKHYLNNIKKLKEEINKDYYIFKELIDNCRKNDLVINVYLNINNNNYNNYTYNYINNNYINNDNNKIFDFKEIIDEIYNQHINYLSNPNKLSISYYNFNFYE